MTAPQQDKTDTQRRDPAPSRLAYKAHRLWLTPVFRAFLRVGLPVFAILMATGWYLSNPTNRDAIGEKLTNVKRSVQERPEFMVKLMAVEGATPVVDSAVRQILPIDFPISSFDLDLDRMRTEIMKLDVIEDADLRIRPGGVLEVALTERQPVILWRHSGVIDMLDASGHRVASLLDRAARSDLPLITGKGAADAVPEARAILDTAAPLRGELRGLIRVGERRWDVVLKSDQRIQLPSDNPVAALEQVIALHQAQDLFGRDLSVIDMRNPQRPTLRLGATAMHELRRLKGVQIEEVSQ
ncbi:cell division protein FtsQ/DivIB [Aliiroseovarius marinus]|uniref:cell division protein FtsQ/DivIB n=1 Tax=Aliiroseovarius marinus TaxID=2500159 RepID=UPI0010618966|nr:cell division protein FtsQ/DivIB [Aliiroseovarius marinus]